MKKQSTRSPRDQTPAKTSAPKRAASPATRTRRPPANPKTAGRAGAGPHEESGLGPHASGRKLHFGCGQKLLGGWDNYDREVDIARPLPFPSGSADVIFCEHVIEHVDYRAAMAFLFECRRVLRPDGVLRVAFPDVNLASGLKHIRSIMLGHGHRSAWSTSLLRKALFAADFSEVHYSAPGVSLYLDLKGLETRALFETSVLEGVV